MNVEACSASSRPGNANVSDLKAALHKKLETGSPLMAADLML